MRTVITALLLVVATVHCEPQVTTPSTKTSKDASGTADSSSTADASIDAASIDIASADISSADVSTPDGNATIAPVQNFLVTPQHLATTLTWDPVDPNIEGVLIRRSQIGNPSSTTDGDLVCATCTSPHLDSNLTGGATYYYTAWAYAGSDNYSAPSHGQASLGMVWGQDSLQQAYLKASNADQEDTFGFAVALSDDGSTLAIGAYREDSTATGIDGDQLDNTGDDVGAVYVFTAQGTGWAQQAYIKPTVVDDLDSFGNALSLSADGNTLVVGAMAECSNATGVNGDASDNSLDRAGAAYIFVRQGTTWSQQAYIKSQSPDIHDRFGTVVSISSDGNTVAIGCAQESSGATGVNGDATDNSATKSGAVYVFLRQGSTWSQQAYVKASNAESQDQFGSAVALSSDGNTMAVGAIWESSDAAGVGGDQTNNSSSHSGAVYVFLRQGVSWSQQAYLKASNRGDGDQFGSSLSLAGDGDTLVVGATRESSGATGVGGDQNNDSAPLSGAVYVFGRLGDLWSQQVYIKSSNAERYDRFGKAVALAADGSTLAVGADKEDSSATGINGDQSDNAADGSGAVYVFGKQGSVWAQQAYFKASNVDADDLFGEHLDLSGDGSVLIVGAAEEDSNATGVDGNQLDNSADHAGAAYVFSR